MPTAHPLRQRAPALMSGQCSFALNSKPDSDTRPIQTGCRFRLLQFRSPALCSAGRRSAEDTLGRALGRSHRGLHILATGAIVRKHVD
ncbi:hypothetical protein chiPu_0033281, partial [Chiloscyllium punctatum]|nr:hypothetical protein [Chiloscyllium punctatum]